MNMINKVILVLLLLPGCITPNTRPDNIAPLIRFQTEDGLILFDHPSYNIEEFTVFYVEPDRKTLERIDDCYGTFILGSLGGIDRLYLDFGNGDIDTLKMEWQGGNTSYIESNRIQNLYVYYNRKLVKSWDMNDPVDKEAVLSSYCLTNDCEEADCEVLDIIFVTKSL